MLIELEEEEEEELEEKEDGRGDDASHLISVGDIEALLGVEGRGAILNRILRSHLDRARVVDLFRDRGVSVPPVGGANYIVKFLSKGS